MGENTTIEWADHTWSPWWGCSRVSPACDRCYAETLAHRFGHDVWTKDGPRRLLSDAHWREPLKWDRAAAERGVPARVFCASMADVFESHTGLTEHRQRLFDLIEATPHLIWMLLTKRPQHVTAMVPRRWLETTYVDVDVSGLGHRRIPAVHGWPSHVWIGTTVEDNLRARIRIPRLLDVPAPVRFLSCEPLLESLAVSRLELGEIGWVITGAESGPGARSTSLEWIRELRDRCARASVPLFVKQLSSGGARPVKALDEFPDDLRIREFPS